MKRNIEQVKNCKDCDFTFCSQCIAALEEIGTPYKEPTAEETEEYKAMKLRLSTAF